MQRSSEQPLVGEERYVTTLITAAKETRCREDSLKGLKTKALLVKRYAQCIDFNSSLTVISYKYFFLIRFAEWRNT